MTDVIRAADGVDGIAWSILGQTYVPKHVNAESFAWHGTFPAGTFVPPHVHPAQDEFVYVLEGAFTLATHDGESTAGPGDLLRLPRGQSHGIFNRSGETARSLFWVTPTGRLFDLFAGLDALEEQSPDAVVALAAEHDVHFLPPQD